jgi:hypothetical protein
MRGFNLFGNPFIRVLSAFPDRFTLPGEFVPPDSAPLYTASATAGDSAGGNLALVLLSIALARASNDAVARWAQSHSLR